jgi:hypothetical protein
MNRSEMRRIIAIVLGLFFLFNTLAQALPIIEESKGKSMTTEYEISKEALERKERSEVLLKKEAVPINPYLPVIETVEEAKHRSVEEVAYRALALLVVSLKGEGLSQDMVDRLVKDYGLESHFSPSENAFIRDINPSKKDRVQFSWRYESAWVFLWALGYVEELNKPVAICDVTKAVEFMKKRSVSQFIKDSRLRSVSEILDQADLIYRYRWALVDARIKGDSPPSSLNPGVALERHYALNWLIGYADEDWDDVSTDT